MIDGVDRLMSAGLRRVAGVASGVLLGYALAQGAPLNLLFLAAVLLVIFTVRELMRNERSLDGVWSVGLGACGLLAAVGLPALGLLPCAPASGDRCTTPAAQMIAVVSLVGVFVSLVLALKDRPLRAIAQRR